MPVITLASPRSATGKSTAALLLALGLRRHGGIAVIDAGAGATLARCSRIRSLAGVHVVDRVCDADAIKGAVDSAAARAAYVVVELDGMTSPGTKAVLALSDMVLIPTRERFDDVAAMPGAIRAIQHAGEAARRYIPHAALLSRRQRRQDGRAFRQIAEKLEAMDGVRLLDVVLDECVSLASVLAADDDDGGLESDHRALGAEVMEIAEALALEVRGLAKEPGLVSAGSLRNDAAAPAAVDRDETTVQFSIRGPRWVADAFRGLCKEDRRTHADMLRLLMEAYEREEPGPRSVG